MRWSSAVSSLKNETEKQRREMRGERIIALLGRRDRPTDAVEDYCRLLGQALAGHGFELEIRRVPWDEHGWGRALHALKLQAQTWRDAWVLVQYTALAWSRRGFPRRILAALRILRAAGARITVVYHDLAPFGGTRLIARVRRAHQLRVMRAAQRYSDCCVLTVAVDHVPWLRGALENTVFIPVGANLALPVTPQNHDALHSPPTVGIFGITGGASGERETRDIVESVRHSAKSIGAIRLLVFGRHAELREAALREGLRDLPVQVEVEGVIGERDLLDRFAAIDVLLFVRGQISSRRGSAIAGIACGVPVIAAQGDETASPMTDAGVLLLSEEIDDEVRQRQLGESLLSVLSDQSLRTELIRRNHEVYEKSLSWAAIAKRYSEFLRAGQSN
jgi:glycosyltransferase involved in cell wall biosynthesis